MPTTPLQRKDAPAASTWNAAAVYATWDAWQADYDAALADLPQLAEFAGTLTNAETVARWLAAREAQWRRVARLSTYARMARMVDMTDGDARRMMGQAMLLNARFGETTSFAEPELVAQGAVLLDWAAEHPSLAVYRHYFDNLLRLAPHRRSPEVETLLSMLAEPFAGAGATARELGNSDLRFQPAVDSQGAPHAVHQATITPAGIQSADRRHRRSAWENFCDGYLGLENTFAAAYITSVKQQVFLARARGFDSVLAMRLSPTNTPLSVFDNIINTFQARLPVWHRYWDVKRRLLGQTEVAPYDVWAPVVDSAPPVPFVQAVDWIGDALAPLGDAYVDTMRRGCLEEGWVDWAPNAGKAQGAAASRRIDTPPFIFMSYDDTMMGVSVLAHELGHSMHAVLADDHQPGIYNDYSAISSTVTETASNFHQALLAVHLQRELQQDPRALLALLDAMMFNYHRYFFTMPTLARFEYEVYARAERGQPLTASILNGIMSGLYAEGYGDTMSDDPARSAITWAQFGHLFVPFYTFQYAVGITAANALADGVLAGGQPAVDRYLAMLAAGGSRYTMDLFALAGLDMNSPAPVERAFGVLEGIVGQMEALIPA
jgi:oligoendopeptidase F